MHRSYESAVDFTMSLKMAKNRCEYILKRIITALLVHLNISLLCFQVDPEWSCGREDQKRKETTSSQHSNEYVKDGNGGEDVD